MTDNELKFFDPETGKPLHRVPGGATIPGHMPYGFIGDGKRWWCPQGFAVHRDQKDNVPRFTREPIAPPLPTEPGFYVDKDGDLWKLVDGGVWELIDGCIYPRESVASYAPFAPVTLVPTEAWDRLRVLDPEDKRDRVDRNGDVWHLTLYDKWEASNDRACVGISTLHRYYGPLRFADEEGDR